MFILSRIYSYLFTKAGLVTTFLIALFLWFARDYPTWRSKKLTQLSREQNQFDQHKLDQHSVNEQKEEQETDNAQKKDKVKDDSAVENVSLAHYVLVAPFAAFYIVVRAIMDAIRFTIYYLLWSIERSIPYIDDFLFDTLTVRIPKAITHTEHWWTEKGKPATIRFKNSMNENVVPATINAVEVSFVGLYQASEYFYKCIIDLINVWKRFVDRHDWKRLADDLCEVWYRMFWRPTVFIIIKTQKLCQIVYKGCYSAYYSIKKDIIWLVDIGIPAAYNYIISTRLAQFIHSGLTILGKYGTLVMVNVRDYLLAPTFGRLLTWIVKGIDQMILMLQQNRFQEHCQQIYRFLAPGITWMLLQSYQLIQGLSTTIQTTFDQIILPSYRLFTKHIVPRLSVAYQHLSNKLFEFYLKYIYPTWEVIYPLIQLPLIWFYKHASGPIHVLGQLCYKQVLLGVDTGTRVFYKLASLFRQFIYWCAGYTGKLYQYIMQWLEKQAPILSKLIQDSWEKIYNQDWELFRNEFWNMMIPACEWTNKQAILVYESLERSLTTWASEQGATFEDKDIQKKND